MTAATLPWAEAQGAVAGPFKLSVRHLGYRIETANHRMPQQFFPLTRWRFIPHHSGEQGAPVAAMNPHSPIARLNQQPGLAAVKATCLVLCWWLIYSLYLILFWFIFSAYIMFLTLKAYYYYE